MHQLFQIPIYQAITSILKKGAKDDVALCKIVDVSVCASQAAATKAQPLWQQLGYQAKIYERKNQPEWEKEMSVF